MIIKPKILPCNMSYNIPYVAPYTDIYHYLRCPTSRISLTDTLHSDFFRTYYMSKVKPKSIRHNLTTINMMVS